MKRTAFWIILPLFFNACISVYFTKSIPEDKESLTTFPEELRGVYVSVRSKWAKVFSGFGTLPSVIIVEENQINLLHSDYAGELPLSIRSEVRRDKSFCDVKAIEEGLYIVNFAVSEAEGKSWMFIPCLLWLPSKDTIIVAMPVLLSTEIVSCSGEGKGKEKGLKVSKELKEGLRFLGEAVRLTKAALSYSLMGNNTNTQQEGEALGILLDPTDSTLKNLTFYLKEVAFIFRSYLGCEKLLYVRDLLVEAHAQGRIDEETLNRLLGKLDTPAHCKQDNKAPKVSLPKVKWEIGELSFFPFMVAYVRVQQ